MVYGLIICAGKQSRFKSETPKALVEFKGKSLLQRNIDSMSPFCDKIFVVCSFENEKYFDVENKIVIESGKGSGDAVWQALENLETKKGDTCFILWGDSLQSKELFNSLITNFKGISLIPCAYEETPYVQVIEDKNTHIKVRFSKFNECITAGFHDLSLFYCEAFYLLKKLREFHDKILDEYGNYIHKHNNEMEFLDVFNETDIKAEIFECRNYKDFSFNTVEQFKELVKKIDK